jgi:hypothetical protein
MAITYAEQPSIQPRSLCARDGGFYKSLPKGPKMPVVGGPTKIDDRPQERAISVEIASCVRHAPPHMRSEAVAIPLPQVTCVYPCPPPSGQPNAVGLPPRLPGPGQPGERIRSDEAIAGQWVWNIAHAVSGGVRHTAIWVPLDF